MLKRVVAFVSIAVMLSSVVYADTWDIDKVHSNVGFSVRHLVITKVLGKFNEFAGQVEFDGKNVEGGSVEITIQMTSIDTDNQKRDDHLKGTDFFNVEEFPEMTFKSNKVIKGNDANFKIIGDLTIKGISKEVTLDAEFNGSLAGPWGGTRAGFSATTTINRQDFDMKWSKALEAGGLIVGDEVTIILELELVKVK